MSALCRRAAQPKALERGAGIDAPICGATGTQKGNMRHGHWYRRALWATFALGAVAWIASGFYPWVGVGVLVLMAFVALVMPDT